jgi:hypothetical protein
MHSNRKRHIIQIVREKLAAAAKMPVGNPGAPPEGSGQPKPMPPMKPTPPPKAAPKHVTNPAPAPGIAPLAPPAKTPEPGSTAGAPQPALGTPPAIAMKSGK